MNAPALYAHQQADLEFIRAHPRVLNFSDCGTGKTRTAIEAIRIRKTEGRTLVICPKSIMQPAWGADLRKFAPELKYSLAYADNRAEAFAAETDVVIINHDGVKWLADVLKKRIPILDGFCQCIVDESSGFKNASQRSAAMLALRIFFKYRIIMTGTPYTESLCDLWRQVYIADDGQRLGPSFYKYRDTVAVGKQYGNGATIWEDRAGMEPVIYEQLKDIAIRHRLEDCVDIPPRETVVVPTTLNKKHQALYDTLYRDALLELENGTVNALNAAVLANKLLQVASGAVYATDGRYEILDTDRYELVAELAAQRPQCVIAFQWNHQKTALQKLLPRAGTIDGTVDIKTRNRLVADFQNGDCPILLIHPKAGAHGLTLTAGHDTIWASPTYSAETFIQFNHRIYRAGQTKKTRTVLISATDTIEPLVYDKLQGKLDKAALILSLFTQP